jgi:hypothetical protein
MTDISFGGSANGDLLSSMGEYTEVASANLGVRGTLSDISEDEEDLRSRVKGVGRFFPSENDIL